MNRPYSLSMIIIAMMFTSCTLDEIVDHGATCPPNGKEGVVLVWDEACYDDLDSDNCQNGFNTEVRDGACPANYGVCQKNESDESDYLCKKSGEYCCGPECRNCHTDNVKSVSCVNSKCNIIKCAKGYQLIDDKCIENCPEGDRRCVNDTSLEICEDGVYVLELCSKGDKCESGQCLQK